MKKVWAFFILVGFLFVQVPCCFSQETLPDLPDLPVFDEVLPPDGLDVFAPASTPAQVAPKTPVSQTTQTAKPSAANTNPMPTASKMTPVSSTKTTTNQTTTNTTTNTNSPKPTTANTTTTNTEKPVNASNNSYYKNNIKNSTIKIKKGKKFKVRIQQAVSDKTTEGSRISFVSTYPETFTYATIPAGTVFKGTVTNTHEPWLTGNGGLIAIKVDQMVYGGKTYEIDAKVSVANGKRIFLNNIKGKRMYFQSIPKALKPGTNYFKKMWKVTCKLAQNDSGVEIILTPFSFAAGAAVYAVNFVASPVLAIFYKGKSITIPQNSPFTIQLREEVLLVK